MLNPDLFLISIISLLVHDFSHVITAYYFGDKKVSFNPLSYADPYGLLFLFIIGVGWAKPIIVDHKKLTPGSTLICIASGPLANLCLAMIGYMFYIVYQQDMVLLFSKINLVIAIFNLLPIRPLDGYAILTTLRRKL